MENGNIAAVELIIHWLARSATVYERNVLQLSLATVCAIWLVSCLWVSMATPSISNTTTSSMTLSVGCSFFKDLASCYQLWLRPYVPIFKSAYMPIILLAIHVCLRLRTTATCDRCVTCTVNKELAILSDGPREIPDSITVIIFLLCRDIPLVIWFQRCWSLSSWRSNLSFPWRRGPLMMGACSVLPTNRAHSCFLSWCWRLASLWVSKHGMVYAIL